MGVEAGGGDLIVGATGVGVGARFEGGAGVWEVYVGFGRVVVADAGGAVDVFGADVTVVGAVEEEGCACHWVREAYGFCAVVATELVEAVGCEETVTGTECCECVGYAKTPVVATETGAVEGVVVATGPGWDTEAVMVLKASGVDVRGGGNGVPFRSPLILRFKGGSRTICLSFFLLCFGSLATEAAWAAC